MYTRCLSEFKVLTGREKGQKPQKAIMGGDMHSMAQILEI